MITTQGLDIMSNAIMESLFKARYVIGGQIKYLDITSKTVENGLITVNVYVSESVLGTITEVSLLDINNTVMVHRPDSIVKPLLEGLLIVFKFTVSEVS